MPPLEVEVSQELCEENGCRASGLDYRVGRVKRYGDKPRRGAVIVLLTVLIPVLLILAGYAINIAYIEGVHCEVQLVTDAAVQAAGREYMLTGNRNDALAAARLAAQNNPIDGLTIPINMSDLEFGIGLRASLASGYSFSPVAANQVGNAVRLRTQTLQSQVTPLFAPVFPTFGIAPEIRPVATATSTQSVMDVALVIDRSGSMAYAINEVANPYVRPAAMPLGWVAGDPVPPSSRWLDTVAAVQSFTQFLQLTPQPELLSLSSYSDSSTTDQVLTADYTLINDGMQAHSISFYGGATAIGLGLLEGHAALTDPALSRPFAVKVMVLLTDGIHNTSVSPEIALGTLQNDGVTLFTVTFSDEADQGRMSNLAEDCGGQHFHAVTAAQLESAFSDIAKRLPSLMTQ